MPVVSAVGHETDVTIADFVADLRAPTPSAAAEMVVPTRDELLERVAAARAKAAQAARYRLAMLERRLRQQGIERAMGILHRRLGRSQQRIDELGYRMRERMRASLDARERVAPAPGGARWRVSTCGRGWPPTAAAWRPCTRPSSRPCAGAWPAAAPRWEQLAAELSQLSPLLVLERGYAIVSNESGILKDAAAAPPESGIHVRLARGSLEAVVSAIPDSPPRSGGHR